MALPKLSEVQPFAVAPRCQRRPVDPTAGTRAGQPCGKPATHWLVSDDDAAVCVECEECAAEVLSEYHAAADTHPALRMLAGWRMVPITMYEPELVRGGAS